MKSLKQLCEENLTSIDLAKIATLRSKFVRMNAAIQREPFLVEPLFKYDFQTMLDTLMMLELQVKEIIVQDLFDNQKAVSTL
jgi:hypothetical protein